LAGGELASEKRKGMEQRVLQAGKRGRERGGSCSQTREAWKSTMGTQQLQDIREPETETKGGTGHKNSIVGTHAGSSVWQRRRVNPTSRRQQNEVGLEREQEPSSTKGMCYQRCQ
jgi:hypothetical protein